MTEVLGSDTLFRGSTKVQICFYARGLTYHFAGIGNAYE
jgi:hypothetical protein